MADSTWHADLDRVGDCLAGETTDDKIIVAYRGTGAGVACIIERTVGGGGVGHCAIDGGCEGAT